jgi:spore coat protein JB
MNEQQKLLQRIRALNFAVIDAGMYLDTHPDCRHGLAYFRKHQAALKAAKAEYAQKFGPLTLAEQTGDERWDWIDGPWPWEGKV